MSLGSKIDAGERLTPEEYESLMYKLSTVLTLNVEEREELRREGFSECVVQFFTSNLRPNDLSIINAIARSQYDGARVLGETYHSPTYVIGLHLGFGQSGDERRPLRRHYFVPMQDNYIKVVIPSRGPRTATIGMQSVSVIRALFGTLAAGEMHFEVTIDLETGKHAIDGGWRFYPKDTDFVDDLRGSKHGSEVPHIMIKPLAMDMISAAGMSDDHDFVIFIHKWTAVEIQIGDTAEERIQFCRKELCSEIISREAYRLHQIRSKYLHKGLRNGLNEFDHYSVNSLLRLTLVGDGQMRNSLKAEYEKRILAHRAVKSGQPARDKSRGRNKWRKSPSPKLTS